MFQRIRLLIILDPSNAFSPEASERKIIEITAMMDKKWKIHLISSGMTSYKNLSCDYKIHKVPLLSTPDSILSRVLYLLRSVYRGTNLVKKYDLQAVMSKDGHLHLGLVTYLVGGITRRKRIIRVNEDDVLALILFIKRLQIPILSNEVLLRIIEFVSRRIENFLFKHAECVVTHGPVHYKRIRRLTEKIAFVPLWVDTKRFKPLPNGKIIHLKKRYIGISDDSKIVLFVGRLHPEKDVRTLLYGFRKLVEVRNDATLVVIGGGPDKERCIELTKDLGIEGRVKFLGSISHEKLPGYYNIADVYVLTSITEELSNTIMEAMACGTPVIATNVGGNPYLIKDGETGILVPPENAEALSKKIAFALDHLDEVNNMASKALLNVRKFRKQAIGEQYKDTIIGAISEKRLQLRAGLH